MKYKNTIRRIKGVAVSIYAGLESNFRVVICLRIMQVETFFGFTTTYDLIPISHSQVNQGHDPNRESATKSIGRKDSTG